ncbi:MAG: aminotransferase class V-fold PLP-dependent enzyme [Ignavibacteriales bacterium]|nr:aminotransferase class V-fold PLP-dependent enzyme [Ignavibacteriales bacterium]
MSEFNPAPFRDLFPFLSKGTVYLDHAAIGPVPRPSRAAVENYLRDRTENDIICHVFLKTYAETKARIGTLLNASPDRIAFCDNTSHGLNILAAGLKWKTGDRILLTDVEFPANVYPFLNQKRHGVEIDFVRCRNNRIPVEDVLNALTPHTRLLSISHVQFLNGCRSDLAAIGDLCRTRGVIFSVDAIQAAGAVPIDVKSMKIDFLSCGSQKWLLSTEGVAFVYVSEETQARIEQAYLGWLGINDFFSDFFRYRLDLDATARRYEGGTLNIAGILSLNESIRLLLDVGIHNIEKHLHELTQLCVDRIVRERVELLTPETSADRAGIVSFRPPNAQQTYERLKTKGIVASIREECIRFSPHFYNTHDEVLKALDVAFS